MAELAKVSVKGFGDDSFVVEMILLVVDEDEDLVEVSILFVVEFEITLVVAFVVVDVLDVD